MHELSEFTGLKWHLGRETNTRHQAADNLKQETVRRGEDADRRLTLQLVPHCPLVLVQLLWGRAERTSRLGIRAAPVWVLSKGAVELQDGRWRVWPSHFSNFSNFEFCGCVKVSRHAVSGRGPIGN